jgi:hypothetical protein
LSVRLAAASGNSAAYEIAIDAPGVRKIWRVGLVQGEDFARVSCWFEKATPAGTPGATSVNILSVKGGRVAVSGQPLDSSKSQGSGLLSFSSAAPYASVAAGNAYTTIAVPADSRILPYGWLASSTAIVVRAPDAMLTRGDDSQLQFLVGVGDSQSAQELGHRALAGTGQLALDTPADHTGEGFLLQVTPLGQESSVGVYKKYKSAF